MQRPLKALLMVLAITTLAGTAWFFIPKQSLPKAPVTLMLRVSVSPRDKTGFAAAQANSAMFKYEIGKKAGVKPVLAQQFATRALADMGILESRVAVQSREEARRLAEAFMTFLQDRCGADIQLNVIDQKIK
jgi:hypothetical protein